MASVPEEVIGLPEIDKKAGTVAATEVTVPPVLRVVQMGVAEPWEVNTCPVVPAAVKLYAEPVPMATAPAVGVAVAFVPPFATGSAVPEYVIAKVPDVVIGLPDTDRKAGTVAATEVTVPVPPVTEALMV